MTIKNTRMTGSPFAPLTSALPQLQVALEEIESLRRIEIQNRVAVRIVSDRMHFPLRVLPSNS